MKATLIYDGECPLCRKAAGWVTSRAVPGTLEAIPCQSEERCDRFPQVDLACCMKAMLLVLPDGTIHSGDQALPHLLAGIRRWRWLAWVLRAPGLARLSPRAYDFVARHRHMFSIIAARKQTPAPANLEDGKEPK